MLTIAVDMDDVLLHSDKQIIDFYNSKYPNKVDFEKHNYDLIKTTEEDPNVDADTLIAEVEEFLIDGPFKDTAPKDGSFEVLKELKKHYRLVIVTGRAQSLAVATKDWLDRMLPGVFEDMRLCGSANWGMPGGVSKIDALKELGADIFIDDHPNYCEQAVSIGVRTVLFGDLPWSRDAHVEGAERALDWAEVGELLLDDKA